ncbi:MAG: hypothetical protein OXH47_08960 [Paracoccaceae bacterium]|nr:hypothetical protein [Paracoccaceae bacterium]
MVITWLSPPSFGGDNLCRTKLPAEGTHGTGSRDPSPKNRCHARFTSWERKTDKIEVDGERIKPEKV